MAQKCVVCPGILRFERCNSLPLLRFEGSGSHVIIFSVSVLDYRDTVETTNAMGAASSCRVGVIDRIIPHISVEIDLVLIPDRIGLHEPPDRKSTRLNSSHTDISRMPS